MKPSGMALISQTFVNEMPVKEASIVGSFLRRIDPMRVSCLALSTGVLLSAKRLESGDKPQSVLEFPSPVQPIWGNFRIGMKSPVLAHPHRKLGRDWR